MPIGATGCRYAARGRRAEKPGYWATGSSRRECGCQSVTAPSSARPDRSPSGENSRTKVQVGSRTGAVIRRSRTNQSSITHAAFAPTLKARPPEFPPFEVTLRSLALRPGSSLAIPRTALSMGFNRFGFPYGCHPSYGSLVPFPAGLAPAEHACLTWTHNVSVDSTANGRGRRNRG